MRILDITWSPNIVFIRRKFDWFSEAHGSQIKHGTIGASYALNHHGGSGDANHVAYFSNRIWPRDVPTSNLRARLLLKWFNRPTMCTWTAQELLAFLLRQKKNLRLELVEEYLNLQLGMFLHFALDKRLISSGIVCFAE